MSLIPQDFDVKSIIFSQFWPGTFSRNCWKKALSRYLMTPSCDNTDDIGHSVACQLGLYWYKLSGGLDGP